MIAAAFLSGGIWVAGWVAMVLLGSIGEYRRKHGKRK